MATTTVRSLDDLYQALSQAQGGDTIELAGGNYGDLYLGAKSGYNLTFPSNVTITSEDPNNPAVFSSMDIRDVTNLTFDGVTFDYEFSAGDKLFYQPFKVTSSDNITIRNSTFDGDVARGVSDTADGFGYAFGLGVRGSSGVTLESNEVFDFYRGFVVSDSNDVEVLSNDVHSIRMDGMNFSQIDGVRIEGNYLHDFNVSPNSLDHRDMIQFWTNGTTEPSRDIVITGNHLDIGEGGYTQSIFMRNDLVDRGLAGEEMFYQNVSITDNVIVNAHLHGITVGETNDLNIVNNSVLHADGDTPDGADRGLEIPAIRVSETSTNVTISQNVTGGIVGWDNQTGWSVRDNALVQDQDPTAPGFYNDVFVSSSLQATDGVHSFVALSGGIIDRLGAGATATQAGVQNNELAASFHVETPDDNPAMRTFDAQTTLIDGATLPEGTTYVWNFGDGQTGTGQRISHSYGDGGNYDVTLTIRLPDGRSDRIDMAMNVAGSKLLDMRADGHFVSHEAGVQEAINMGGMATLDGLRLGVGTNTPTVEREFVERLTQTDEFNINLSLRAESAGDGGEVFRLHGTMIASITNEGEVHVILIEEDGGQVKLTTTGGNITDTAEHDISISLQNGVLSVAIDGAVRGSVPDVGTLNAAGSHDLVFGNPWGKDSFEGLLTSFAVSTDASDYGPSLTLSASAPAATSRPVTLADFAFEQPLEPSEDPTPAEPDVPEGAIRLDDTGVAARFEREDVNFLPGADAFDISVSLQANELDSSGEVFRLQNSLVTHVNAKGELVVRAYATDGMHTRLDTSDANLADGKQHDITISLSDGILSVSIDGKDAGTMAVPEPLGDYGAHDLMIGNPRGVNNFDATIFSFEASAPPAPGEPVTPPVTLEAATRSDVSTILSSVLKSVPDNQAALPTTGQAVDGMETTIGPFDAYYHDLSYFYS